MKIHITITVAALVAAFLFSIDSALTKLEWKKDQHTWRTEAIDRGYATWQTDGTKITFVWNTVTK